MHQSKGVQTMKLSKAQEAVMTTAKSEIDFARSHSLREWAEKETHNTPEQIEKILNNWDETRHRSYTKEQYLEAMNEDVEMYMKKYGKYYEEEKNAIVLIRCNSRTLTKLEQMGLIEIIYDSNGSSFGIDTIKVLNY